MHFSHDTMDVMTAAAIRQTVIVQPGGVVHFTAPELQEGTEAEVIVLVTSSPKPEHRLAAFQALQQSLALTAESAEKWIRDAAAERKAFGPA
jgi:hypothetical protein